MHYLGDKTGMPDYGMDNQASARLHGEDFPELGASIYSGVKAGCVGVLLMVVFMLWTSQNGFAGIWISLRMMASHFAGSDAPGMASFIIILITCYIMLGAAFGLIMAKIVGKVGIFTAIGFGGTYGLWIWIIGQYVLIPALLPPAHGVFEQNILALANLIYGISLGLFGSAYRVLPEIIHPMRQICEFHLKHKPL